ncbi:MAG: branched-chain amino acid transport system substrate-binding protein [Spirochaetes bacterium]|nr:MAG: branched-chain amino acid transport system substrate-binding protein [Spirochaetota bacterium]
MKRTLLAVVAIVLLIAGAGAQDKVIKIGTLFPLTGSVATAGQRCQAAVETIVDIINGIYPDLDLPIAKKAGLLNGYKIELIKADHQGKPDVAKSEAERLYEQEGVFAVIGSYNSSASKPASAVAERLQKIFMCGASSSAALTERGLQYFFRLAPTDRIENVEFAHWIEELNKVKAAGIKTAAVIYENTEFGKHAADEAKVVSAKMGVKIVADVPFTPGATNLNSEIQKLKAARPDALFAAVLGADYSLMIRTMKQSAWKPKMAINYCGGYQDPKIAEQMGKDGWGFMGSAGYTPEFGSRFMKAVAPVEKYYKAKVGVPFDTEKVAQVLRTTTFDSPLSMGGKVQFGPDGQNIKAASVISQLQNGSYVTVYPYEFKDGDPIFPMPNW